ARSVSAMLSPVSPSATGNTLRSLTSSRRDSRCASAPATTARKRTRFVSVTAVCLSPSSAALPAAPGFLRRLQHLSRFQTARAHVHPARRLSIEDPHLLQVRVEATLRRNHRVAAALAERRPLAAAVTHLCHGGP